VQYRAIRYTQRLAEAGAVASVGSKGDSYDNAMAEAFNSLYKAELVRNKGPWRGLDDLEMATVEYIDWYNNRRPMPRICAAVSKLVTSPNSRTFSAVQIARSATAWASPV
jgi:transposase InsO family protein